MTVREHYENLYKELDESIPYHMFNSTTYVEVQEPYYALIKSKGTSGWVDKYEEEVCKIESKTLNISDKRLASKAKTVYEDYAFIKYVIARYPNLKHEEYMEAKKEFKEIKSDTILVLDSSLM